MEKLDACVKVFVISLDYLQSPFVNVGYTICKMKNYDGCPFITREIT